VTTYPRITVVTPSYNQAAYLERTIRSVLDQAYPNLEYFIIDGGSTDGSIEIIQRYADRLAYWVSEPDSGQANAINKGLRRATGDWIAWQNSDDVYLPGAFAGLAGGAARQPKAGVIIGDLLLIDADDRPLRDVRYVRPTHRSLLAEGMVLANQASFWKRELHTKVGLIDENYHYSFDYEWFLRLTATASSHHVPEVWGGFRLHDAAKTGSNTARFTEENAAILSGRELSAWQKRLYVLRRAGLMAARGQLGYLTRALVRRASGKASGLI
jgi:glycosyltransferase involved in cell wall biosynthesis